MKHFDVLGISPLLLVEWISETISGKKKAEHRELGALIQKMQKGDTLIVSELSRLGRSITDVLLTVEKLKEKGSRLICVKERIDTSNNDLTTRVMTMSLAMCAEIERELISQRTKEALAAKKAAGVVLGRPKGADREVKYDKYRDDIMRLLGFGFSKRHVCEVLGLDKDMLNRYLRRLDNIPIDGEDFYRDKEC